MSSKDATIQLESLVGTRLPDDFRAWLTDDSAPYPVPSNVTIPDDCPWIDEVAMLYHAAQIRSETAEEYDMNRQGVRNIPRDTIAIGNNGEGDLFLLSLRQADFGSVYYLFHETASPQDDDCAGIFVLAPRFSDWLATLVQKQPDPNTPDWESIRKQERDKILNSPSKPWWKFW